jgi:nucleotide-binding universal stress UspA family protein
LVSAAPRFGIENGAKDSTSGIGGRVVSNAEEIVSKAGSLAQARGVEAKREVIRHTGHSTTEGVIEYAKENNVDLIVVGATGIGE